MKIKCQINGHTCVLPSFLTRFLVKPLFLYCSTITPNGKPQIQPIIFVNELGKCNIAFLVKKQSSLTRNLQKNPKLALTTDETHPTDPLKNKGIMIEAVSQLNDSKDEVEECFNYLRKKYNSDIVTKILGIDIILNYVKIQAFPVKIVYWKGPFFKKFKCNQR
ncbi:MAG: pyridoxamine 5'-phosphate oxidase family protein [Candidatus Heimdallarchaeota archaeon]|nr:MAG: pyridoxamine 5'-phosphate oxidase family protein [Candidatus Heimdallarchaeota archaeon]